MQWTLIDGENAASVTLYALSTCIWCGKTKKLLNDLGVSYRFIDVDLLVGESRQTAMDEVKRHNPAMSFPTLVINDATIVGYRPDDIKKALNK